MSSTFLSSTAYLPPVSWYLSAISCGEWKLEAHENFQKGGYRNRCRIATANGPKWLSVPLQKGKHQATPIQEVKVSEDTEWARLHQQTIRSAYGRAPYFEFYSDAIFGVLQSSKVGVQQQAFSGLAATQESLLPRPTWHLAGRVWSLNQELLSLIDGFLQLPVQAGVTTVFRAPNGEPSTLDVRYSRQDLPRPVPPYPQLFADRYGFQGDLSILDLLFCLGPEAGSYLRQNAT